MLRITKNMGKISSIKIGENDIDSFLLIPGITIYQGIYSKSNSLWFQASEYLRSIRVDFATEADLERFFIQLIRDIKLNQITNVTVDTKTK